MGELTLQKRAVTRAMAMPSKKKATDRRENCQHERLVVGPFGWQRKNIRGAYGRCR